MPKDFFLPVDSLEVEQVVALGHGHIRYEGAVTKYYFPSVTYVAKHSTSDIFTGFKTFRGYANGIFTNGLAPATGFSFGSPLGGNDFTTQAGTHRFTRTVDLNGSAASGDGFIVTAGFVAMIGPAARVRPDTANNLNTAIATDGDAFTRASSVSVTALVMLTSGLVELDTGVTITGITSAVTFSATTGYWAGVPSTLTFSAAQNSANALVVTVPFRSAASSGNAPGMLVAWENSAGPDSTSTNVYRISVLSAGATVASAFINVSGIVTVGTGGFVGTIPAASIPTSGSYTVRVEEKRPATYTTVPSGYNMRDYSVVCQGVSTVSVSTTLTLTGLDISAPTGGGGVVTGGGTPTVTTVLLSTAVSGLAEDWATQDLQINLRTRAVASSLTTVRLKPGDNAVLGVLFHTGTYVVDPGATAVRLAARGAGNATAYYLYNTNTTIVSVGEANYYRMEVLANDEDLQAGQVASLLAGSNAAQSLVGEIQWTTTAGTFSSDSFTINAPNEVVREPDV